MSNNRKYASCMAQINIGDQFGFLTVERKDEKDGNHKVVTLRCSHCGELKRVPPGNLLHHGLKTCGKPACSQTYKTKQARQRAISSGRKTFTKPLAAGQVFGMLTILEVLSEVPKTLAIRVKAICECGTVCYVRPSTLLAGSTRTCGNRECTAKMKGRTHRSRKALAPEECSAEFAERDFAVRNKLPVGEYTAGCFENLK